MNKLTLLVEQAKMRKRWNKSLDDDPILIRVFKSDDEYKESLLKKRVIDYYGCWYYKEYGR